MNDAGTSYVGLLIASDWDDKGTVLAIDLLVEDEKEIPILMNQKAQSLIPYCKHRVRIKGSQKNGFLNVISFKILKSHIRLCA